MEITPHTDPVPVRRPAARALLASALGLASVAALFVSAAAFAVVRFQDWTVFFAAVAVAALWLLVGGVLLGLSLWLSPWRIPFMQPSREVETPRVALLPLIAGVVLLGIGTVAGGRLLGDSWMVSVHVQFALLLAGALLTGWALSGAPGRFTALPGRELALVGALAVLALVLRLIEVTVSTPGLMDEIHFVYGISFIQGDPNLPLLRQASTFLPTNEIYSYWQTLVLSVTGPSLEGLRLVNAVVGAITVPIVYLLARSLFDRRTAFAAALLLATFAPHLFYSRLGYAQIADAMFGALMLALVAYALRGGKRWPWAWAGVALGMTQYFYEGGRLLFPPVVLALFVFLLVMYPRRMRSYLRGMGVMLLAAVLIAAPMYVTMVATGAPFSSRFNDSGASSGLMDAVRGYDQQDPFTQFVTASRFVDPFLSYVAMPDSSGAFYGSDQPMVLSIFVPLLLLGFWHTVWRLRSPALMLLLVVLGGAAGNVLVQETLWYPRYVMVMPLLPVLMAAGLRYTLPLLWPRPFLPAAPRLRAIGAALVPALAVLAAVIQIVYFFGPFREAYAVSFRAVMWAPDSNDAVLRAVALPDPASRQVILVSRDEQDRNVPDGFFGFLVPGEHYPLLTVMERDFTSDYIANLPRDRGYVFFIEPAATDAYARLAAAFPLHAPDYSTRPYIPAFSTYLMFVVPPQELPAK